MSPLLMVNPKVLSYLQKHNVQEDGGEMQDVFTCTTIHGKHIYTKVSATMTKEDLATYGDILNEFDRAVYDSVCTLYALHHLYGRTEYSLHQICERIGFSPNGGGAAIANSIEKMRRIYIRIDATVEFKYRKLHTLDPCMEDYMLDCEETTPGYYKFHSKPIFFDYAAVLKQIYPVPSELLIVPGQNMNVHRATINHYLVRRTCAMKREQAGFAKRKQVVKFKLTRKLNTEILISTVGIECMGTNKYNKVTKHNIARDMRATLDHLVASNHIAGYAPVADSRTLVSYNVSLHPLDANVM